MKIKRLLTLLLIGSVVVSSCKQDEKPISRPYAFSYDGHTYNTLQDAINAAAGNTEDCRHTIQLIEDATGDGTVFPSDGQHSYLLDLGTHIYHLNSDASIQVAGNILDISGEGGSIFSSGTTAALKGNQDSHIYFNGNITLTGENIIDAAADIMIEEGFSGQISGNITLRGGSMRIVSPDCSVNIPVLTVKGETSAFSVESKSSSPNATISVDKIVSDHDFRITAIDRARMAVADASKLHIHNFSKHIVPGDCINSEEYEFVCEECGFTMIERPEEKIYGKCNASQLVLCRGVVPTDSEFGNIEYYRCPQCGRTYSDAEATKEITEDIVIYPTSMEKMIDVTKEANEFIVNADVEVLDVVKFIGDLVPKLLSTKDKIKSSDFQLYLEAVQKINKMSSQLDVISDKLQNILALLTNHTYKERVQRRNSELDNLAGPLKIALKAINEEWSKQQADSVKYQKILEQLAVWGKNGVSDATLSLMQQYDIFVLGLNFPQMYGEIVSEGCIWEHDGYNLRKCLMLKDAAIISLSAVLTKIYNDELRSYNSSVSKDEHRESISTAFTKYIKAIQDDVDLMEKRGELYRRYMPKNVTYSRDICHFNFWGYLDSSDSHRYYPKKNNNRRSEYNCNGLMTYSSGLKDQHVTFMDLSTIEVLHQTYKDKSSIYDLLASLGFRGFPTTSRDKWQFVLDDQRGFGTDGGEHYPCYRFFRWRSHSMSFNQDWFAISPCLDNPTGKPRTKRVEIIDGNIRTSDGYMTYHIVQRGYSFFTIRSVQE